MDIRFITKPFLDAQKQIADIEAKKAERQKTATYYEHPDHPGDKITLTGKRPAWLLEALRGILKEVDCKRWIIENCRQVES